MASPAKLKPLPRPTLSIERVLRAAIDLADAGGLQSLSMRKLARKLGVEAMSLYYYVSSRDAILDAILDLVVKEIEPAPDGTDWKESLRSTAISAHTVLERHPWACGLMMSPARVRAGRMQYMDSMLGRLRRAGFSAELTDRAYHALDSHIIGSTLWEAGYTDGAQAAEAEAPGESGAAFLQALPAGEYRYLAEHVEQHLAMPQAGKTAFEFGLDLILDGLDRILATGRLD
jgi:AcrR family transcriptional regulator